jgi:2-isopropylmalate synthase
VIKNRETYEIIDPAEVGVMNLQLFYSKKRTFCIAYRFKNIGFDVTKNELDFLYQEFLKVADGKKK